MKKSVFPLVLILSLLFFVSSCSMTGSGDGNGSTNYDEFAQCITDSGAKMYGAYWCPHCNDQKDMFSSSWDYIDYIECSLPNKSGQTQICAEEGITGYPTWEFGDESRQSGKLPLDILSERTGCSL